MNQKKDLTLLEKKECYFASISPSFKTGRKNYRSRHRNKMKARISCNYGTFWNYGNPCFVLTSNQSTQTDRCDCPIYSLLQVMTGGCKGFGKRIMEWPEDLIIGGIQRNSGVLRSAEALQSVFLVASPFDVFLRFKEQKDSHPNLDTARWNPGWASDIIFSWQRNFTQKLYGHQANNNTDEKRVFHPLASTSIADMLEEFSQFNYTIIIMAGLRFFALFQPILDEKIFRHLVVIYAAFTQARIDGRWLAIKSNVALSFIGVVLVTYSSICGLGMTTALGINFNAATTQIVPFLSLGLGIDDMFLLLHNYDEIIHTMRRNEMGILLKETGMSVMVTSINNILAFCAGYVLPIPALRSFCSQTAVLLAFNLMSLMFIFPAFIGLDLRRVRAGRRDLVFCGPASDSEKGEKQSGFPYNVSSKDDLTNNAYIDTYTRNQPWYTVGGFLTNFYIPALKLPMIKVLVFLVTICGITFGLYGMYTTTLGLELADVLPENTAPAAFLKQNYHVKVRLVNVLDESSGIFRPVVIHFDPNRAREKYFSFYPMFAVLRGKAIDFPNQQRLIEEYRDALGSTSYMVKANGRLQPYWMSMLRIWLESLQVALDKEIANGTMDPITGMPIKGQVNSFYFLPVYSYDQSMDRTSNKFFSLFIFILQQKPAPEALIARRLVCSYGENYNCTGRSFYNYLTGWYNIDNMMYYVSQASFQPVPPFWQMSSVRLRILMKTSLSVLLQFTCIVPVTVVVENLVLEPSQQIDSFGFSCTSLKMYGLLLDDNMTISFFSPSANTLRALSLLCPQKINQRDRDCSETVVPPARPLLYCQIPFYQTNLTDTPVTVNMIEEVRAVCDEYTEKGLPNFPSGLAFTFWEQYLFLRWNLFCAICIIAFAVFAVISLLMFNPWAAAMVMVIVVIVTIELGGFMGLFGIKMNPISAVSLISAVGIGNYYYHSDSMIFNDLFRYFVSNFRKWRKDISNGIEISGISEVSATKRVVLGVEFTAHVVLAFLTSLGSVDDRLESCLQHMFVPVFHGAISTLLGIVMLVFSEFDFVIKYFFIVMTLLVILAVFNGLCLLPVLLTLVGPDPEVGFRDIK
ncbi:unnamed protein product [Angiostrongylus costaricensis]|uniref:SSD domain-containing protein n=1 Tax=Angiostrongylus costaricensis TaxID=334426 RepID=A0A158PJ13_ANGCS|nr:unnamed protein product [Angiostrongylus costaricensis]